MEADDALGYGVVDEVARCVLLNGVRMPGLQRDDVPRGGPSSDTPSA